MDFEQFYQDKYPAGVSLNVDLDKYTSMVDVFDQAVNKYADRPAFSAVGATLSYRDLDTQSRNFAAWLQNKTDLKPGDRIAVQMPNVSQYPCRRVWRHARGPDRGEHQPAVHHSRNGTPVQ